MADAVLDSQSIPLQPLIAAYAPSQAGNVTGQTEVHATCADRSSSASASRSTSSFPS